MSLKERFNSTKDGRNRFNAIFSSFIIVFMTVWILEFIYFSIFKYIFGLEILIKNISSSCVIILNLIIASYYSYTSYYWHYQKYLIDRDYKDDNEMYNSSIQLNYSQTFSLITYVVYKLIILFFPLSLMMFIMTKNGYLEEIDFIVLIFMLFYFLFYIGKKMYINVDRQNFINLKYQGYMTTYSKEKNA